MFIHIEKLHYEYIDKIHLVKKLSKADNIMTRMNLIYKHKYTLRLIIFLCSALLPLFSMQVVHADTNDIQDVVSQNKIATDDNNSTSTIMPLAATTAADPTDIASGTFGSCNWVIDAGGRLSISVPDDKSALLGQVQLNNSIPDMPWYNFRNQITSVYVGEKVLAYNNSSYLFSFLPNVTSIDVKNLNVQYASTLSSMFYLDPSLTSLTGLETWNISHATNIESLFSSDSSLQSIQGLENWDTSNVTRMVSIFSGDKKLNITGIENWDTSKVIEMSSAFSGVQMEDLSQVRNWDVSKVVKMPFMFSQNSNIKSIDISNWKTNSLEDTGSMFSGCKSLTEVIGIDSIDMTHLTNISSMFQMDSSLITLPYLSNWDTSNVVSMLGVFSGCSKLESLDLTNWNTGNVETMQNMFSGCSKLNENNLKGLSLFDTSEVTNMAYMFQSTGFVNLDLNNFNTSKVTDINYMFGNTSKLQEVKGNFDTSSVNRINNLFYNSNISDISQLNIADWDVSKVTSLTYVFSKDNNLKYIPVGKWDVSNVTDFSYTFYLSPSFENLPVSNWDVSSATTMRGMFWGTGVKTLDVSTWDTSNVDTFYAMFDAMSNLETLDISNFDTTNATDVQAMLKNDTNLWKLTLGPKSVLTNLNGPALEQTASVPTPVPGTAIKDDSTDKTYSAISDKWQVVDTADGGTDHEPLGDLVSAQDIMDKFSTVGNPVTTYVWQQQTKGDMKMTVPDIDFGTTSNASGLVRRKNDFAINVTNSTYPTDAVPSDLYVSMDAPLTDETDKTKTLNDVLVFKDKYNNENVLSSADTKIYSGDIANGPNTISWDDDHGILLDMNHDRYAENGHYSTTLKWTLTNSL